MTKFAACWRVRNSSASDFGLRRTCVRPRRFVWAALDASVDRPLSFVGQSRPGQDARRVLAKPGAGATTLLRARRVFAVGFWPIRAAVLVRQKWPVVRESSSVPFLLFLCALTCSIRTKGLLNLVIGRTDRLPAFTKSQIAHRA
jgi:hypothetical protein